MLKILFICHGNICVDLLKRRIYGGFKAFQIGLYHRFTIKNDPNLRTFYRTVKTCVAELPMPYGNNYHQVSEQSLCPLLSSLTAGGSFVYT